MTTPATKGILEGVKVLDLTRVLAGPWCAQALADMGATVYKVERPGVGDEMRHIPPYLPGHEADTAGTSSAYASLNRGKRSITLDISHAEGQRLARLLASRCDILLENYKAGDLARYGLDYASLRATHPHLIYCSITGYGQDGPMASQPGYDPIFQAISGMMSTCGVPDGQPGAGPQRTTIPYIDVMTGMVATSAVLAALLHQRAGGGGQHLDIALIDVALAATTPYAQAYLSRGKVPGRLGNASQLFAPSNCYRCKNERFLLLQVGNDLQWERFCKALALADWAQDERFRTNGQRLKNAKLLDERLNALFASWDVQALAARLSAAGVPCGPVNTLAEAFEHPQVRHRGIRLPVVDPTHGPMDLVRSPLRFSHTPVRHGALPVLGADTDEILRAELGLAPEAIEGLRKAGVL